MIPPHVAQNFDTLVRAAKNGDLALMECQDAHTGEVRYVLAAGQVDHGEVLFTPFAHMCNGNPYEEYIPPS